MRRTVVTFLSIAASFAWGGAARGLDVPISVQELTPQGVAGRDRGARVVSAGVPLLAQEGVTSVEQLGMSGSPAAQFRVLHRDPNTNDIKWVLATFIASHPGGPYALRDGSGAFGGSDLASDEGARIVVNTGTATFEIRKSGFNLLDRVVHGGSEIVAPHAGGGVVLMDGGSRYESSRDAASETVIEENGPVMAVVRSRGVLLDAFSNRHVGYTARLHFYKGLSRCRAFVTLTNGEL
ncbi:MAG: exo-rhamnogalacturonan lyase family protein, partial [Planctomycetota bacterium]